MKKRKIISSDTALVITLISIFSISEMLGFLIITGVSITEFNMGVVLIFGFFSALIVLLLWIMNRSACIVWVEDGIVKSKGLLWGFHKECPIADIRKVKKYYKRNEIGVREFIYLMNDFSLEEKKFHRIRKESYISFSKTEKNLEFLKTFWDGKIE